MKDMTSYTAVLGALGRADGFVLDWRTVGRCQYVSGAYSRLLTCPEREGRWRCEVIGPHERHRWSEHLMVHERVGNGHSCQTVGDMTLDDLYARLDPSPRVYYGMGVA